MLENWDTITKYINTKFGEFNDEQLIDFLENANEPSFFAIIPLEILEKKTITANAKLLYAEIVALSKKSGKCIATNKYLADRLGLSPESIRGLLKELQDDLLLMVNIKRSERGTYRDIKIKYIGGQTDAGGVGKMKLGGRADGRGQKRNKQREIDKVDTSNGQAVAVQEAINLFKEINPSYERLFMNKTQRGAMARLLEQHGTEKVEQIIKSLPRYLSLAGCPQITTPYDLEKKLGNLYFFVNQQKSKGIASKVAYI